MTLFYNRETLRDTLLIAFNNKSVYSTENFNTHEILYSIENEMIGINIFNVSEHIQLANGMIYPTPEVINFLNKITSIDFSQYLKPNFVVAKVLECEDVEGTHLHKCQVDLGSQVVQIVCGAVNVRKDLKTVCATVGTFMPSGSYIAEGKLMSIPSNGMLCSAKELNLQVADSKPGIIELDDSYHFFDEFKDVYSNFSK